MGPPVASIDRSVKSLTGSYGTLACKMGRFTWVNGRVNMTVWPSGAALATKSAAMMPLAPGLASTMTDWPQRCWSFSA